MGTAQLDRDSKPVVMVYAVCYVCVDGVQLLCLIDKGLDGCRYLQTYGEWQTAAWLARATLRERDCSEVFTKWADHLASVTVNRKVLTLLFEMRMNSHHTHPLHVGLMRHVDNGQATHAYMPTYIHA